jgi:GH24 family phage-related lysozyme (muramidase)
MIPSDLLTVQRDLIQHEACVSHMYLDSKGNVTVGIGEMVPSVEAAVGIPFIIADPNGATPATPAQIASDFVRVQSMGQNSSAPYFAASHYIGAGTVVLPMSICQGRVIKRLNEEFIPGVVRLLPDFESYPLDAKRALLDMIWSLGAGGLAKFHHLLTACKARDWEQAALECNRMNATVSRNYWTRVRFMACVKVTT